MGAFTDFLEFLDRPGQVVRNLLSGNVEGALRQSASFAGDVVDAPLPFDLIPDFVRDEDKIFGSDLVGLDEESNGVLRFGADLGVGILTDPLTYLTGGAGAVARIAAGAARAAKLGAASATAGKASAAAIAAVQKTKKAAGRHNRSVQELISQGTPVEEAAKLVSRLTPEEQTMSTIMKARSAAKGRVRRTRNKLDELSDSIEAGTAADLVMGVSPVAGKMNQLRKVEDQAVKQFQKSSNELRELTGEIATGAKKSIVGVESGKVVRERLPIIVESAISNSGRRALAKQGPEAMPQLVARVTAEIGDDVSKDAITKIISRPEFKEIFDIGGLRIAIPFTQGKQLFTPKQISDSIGRVGDKLAPPIKASLSKLAPLVPSRIKKDFTGENNLIKKVWKLTKDTAGWDFLDSGTRALRNTPMAAGALSAKVNMTAVGQIFANVPNKETDMIIAQVFDNLGYQAGKATALLADNGGQSVDDLLKRLENIQANPNLTDVNINKVDWAGARQSIGELDSLNRTQWEELINARAVGQHVSGADVEKAIGGATHANQGRQSFLTRVFDGKRTEDYGNIMDELFGVDKALAGQVGKSLSAGGRVPNTLKKRVLETDQELLDFLNSAGAPKLERLASVRASRRASQQGSIVARADLTEKLLRNKSFILNDGSTASAVQKVIDNLARVDEPMAEWIQQTYQGIKPRDFSKILASMNRVFKPAAVYGIGIPRFAALTRNEIGGVWQLASTLGPDQALREGKKIGRALFSASTKGWAKATGKTQKAAGQLDTLVTKLDDAFINAKGSVPEMRNLLRKDPLLIEALDNGVLNTFVSSEQLLTKIARTPGMEKVQSVMDMPGEMFQHLEAMLRLGLFKDLRAGGMSAVRAGEIVGDTFLDYSVKSLANRRMRDVIPFAAFISQSIPQQAKLIAGRPAVGVALAQLFRQDEELPGFLQEQATIPFGEDTEGNPLVISSLGLPVEALDVIPNFSDSPVKAGRQFEKEIVGSSQPAIKTAFSLASGRDPFFGTPAFTFDKAPQFLQALGADERGEAGRLFNISKGLGVTQPLITPLSLLEKGLDPRKTATQKALALITGINIATVNPEAAAVNNIRQELLANRNVGQSVNFFTRDNDPESQALVDSFNQARARLRRAKQDKALIDQ